MRLINIDELKGCAIIRPHSREDMKAIKSCSEVIPHNEITTAYDIDKVIEQLKEKSVAYCREYCCAEDENILYLPDAIEIVKKGGVE